MLSYHLSLWQRTRAWTWARRQTPTSTAVVITESPLTWPGMIPPGRLDLALVWAWMIEHLSYLGSCGSRGGTCLCWPMERRQHWGWLMGTKRVRADLDPGLLPWTTVVSTDYLNGFWFVNKINALWITLNPFPCCLDWVSGYLGLSGATWLALLPIIRVLLRSYFPLETKWLHPRVAVNIIEKQKGPLLGSLVGADRVKSWGWGSAKLTWCLLGVKNLKGTQVVSRDQRVKHFYLRLAGSTAPLSRLGLWVIPVAQSLSFPATCYNVA